MILVEFYVDLAYLPLFLFPVQSLLLRMQNPTTPITTDPWCLTHRITKPPRRWSFVVREMSRCEIRLVTFCLTVDCSPQHKACHIESENTTYRLGRTSTCSRDDQAHRDGAGLDCFRISM
ncbi:hypothetical protein KC365_g143 [Hortaea werneckii]|nr:hypothetical protein KC339_g140 [Hortaea werneckii]KAI7245904.1 hypothetical protein KC365_g143 [Hortaea werneckii]